MDDEGGGKDNNERGQRKDVVAGHCFFNGVSRYFYKMSSCAVSQLLSTVKPTFFSFWQFLVEKYFRALIVGSMFVTIE
jgi:hypothetical protein